MVGVRLALGPTAAIAAVRIEHPEAWLGCMIAAGFVSDVYDGVLARRWGTESAGLRVADSAADTIFYLGVLAAVVLRHWPVLHERLGLLLALMILEGLRLGFDWAKFRRIIRRSRSRSNGCDHKKQTFAGAANAPSLSFTLA